MRRLLTVSALVALAIVTTTAIGQPPTSDPLPKTPEKKVEKKADPTDAIIAAALANDPDVKMAKAKMLLAEAELAKAKQTVTLKVLSLTGQIEQLKATVEQAEERLAWAERMFKVGQGAQGQVLEARIALEKAKAALAQAQAELKLLTGGVVGGVGLDTSNPDTVAKALAFLMKMQAAEGNDLTALKAWLALMGERPVVKGPIPDRLRAALDKNVKLGPKGERVTFEKAMEIFKKEAGLDVPVRGPVFQLVAITSEGEELPVGAWFQLFEDHAFLPVSDPKARIQKGRFYVREYGILLAHIDAAPSDAPSLTEFWKQKPPTPKPDPKSDPTPKPK
jgi:hypothetical protein